MAPDMEILAILLTIPKINYGPKVLFLQEVTSAPSFGSFEIVGVTFQTYVRPVRIASDLVWKEYIHGMPESQEGNTAAT